jgi:hypothetical protein
MNATNCAACGISFVGQRSTARFCSERCRKRAHRANPAPKGSARLGAAGSAGVIAGVEATLAALDADGRLSAVDAGKVAILRALAAEVEAAPGNSALWRELRAAEAAVLESAHRDEVADDFAALLAELSAAAREDER